MRTTLTLEDEIARQLRETARKTGQSFKDVVNEALRRGLSSGPLPARRPARFRVRPKACGFRAGIDLSKLNQILDEFEIERASTLVIRDR